jgi:hypothetical protein
MFIGPYIIVIVEEWKTNLMSLAILFHFLCAQHVSDINISIIRSLWLCWWITTSVVLFSVRCVLELRCGWFWVVFVLQAEAQLVLQPATRALVKPGHTKSRTHEELRTRRPMWYFKNTVANSWWCRLKLQPAIRTPLKTSHTKSPTHNELRTRRPMW